MGMENGNYWSEIGSGFGELGGTPSPRIPRSAPSDAVIERCLSYGGVHKERFHCSS